MYINCVRYLKTSKEYRITHRIQFRLHNYYTQRPCTYDPTSHTIYIGAGHSVVLYHELTGQYEGMIPNMYLYIIISSFCFSIYCCSYYY